MLCEKTENEASGSTEALAATLIKYNFKKHKNNGKYSNTKNRVKTTTTKYNHTFTNLVRPSLERRALKQEIDSACKLEYKSEIKRAFLDHESERNDELYEHFLNKQIPEFWKCWSSKLE